MESTGRKPQRDRKARIVRLVRREPSKEIHVFEKKRRTSDGIGRSNALQPPADSMNTAQSDLCAALHSYVPKIELSPLQNHSKTPQNGPELGSDHPNLLPDTRPDRPPNRPSNHFRPRNRRHRRFDPISPPFSAPSKDTRPVRPR